MIRRSFALLAAASLVTLSGVPTASAQESRPSSEFEDEYDRYSDDQLDNLVGAIALYPDALLAQVLVAATFPDQIEDAARFVRANGTDDVDDQNWDVSVKAVAHYPSALNMLADKIDWTAALGRAYAVQSGDVMAAVQRMRGMADRQGNLRSTEQQTIVRDDGNYVIAPTQTRLIYVPVYDPYVVYTRPIFTAGFRTSFWSFGIGFPIGSWLSYDCNWGRRAIYYNGWDAQFFGYAGGWRQRSRPYIRVTNIYINPRYRTVYHNRDVIRRRVIYQNVDRYPGVHRDIRFYRGPVVVRGPSRRFDSDRFDRVDRKDRFDRTDRFDRRDDWGNRQRRNDRRFDDDGERRGAGRFDDRRVYGSDRRDDRERTVIVPQGQGGSIGRPADGTWGRDNGGGFDRGTRGGRGDGGWSRSTDENRGGDRAPRDDGRGRGNGGGRFGGGSSGMMRGPERNDGPMINPRRAERMESPASGGRGTGGGRGGRGGREGRELP